MKALIMLVILAGASHDASAADLPDLQTFKAADVGVAGVKTAVPATAAPAGRESVKFGNCTVVDQSGTIDAWNCREPGKLIHCYADITVNGDPFRVYGGCYATYSDCWFSGPGHLEDPCDLAPARPVPQAFKATAGGKPAAPAHEVSTARAPDAPLFPDTIPFPLHIECGRWSYAYSMTFACTPTAGAPYAGASRTCHLRDNSGQTFGVWNEEGCAYGIAGEHGYCVKNCNNSGI